MSFPNIPNITPTISITTAQTIPLLLSSIALEELALSHIINAKAEEIQFVLGTLPGGRTLVPPTVTISNLLDINKRVQGTLRDVIKKEMLLEFKFENVLDLLATVPPPPSTVTVTLNADPTTICAFGTGPNTSTLTGQVLVNGSPPPAGTPVSFIVSALGTIAPNPALTDASGNFTAIFTSTDGPGMAAVIATALGASSNTVTITINNCQTTITLVGPGSICSLGTGSNTGILTGQVLVNGSPPPPGTSVSFTINNPALGTIAPNPALTDLSGNFTATFTATNGPGLVTVTATAFGAAIILAINIMDCPP
ncbi:hypothetical protein ACIGHG_06405 [Bacillus sp. NPDC077411]|uniref:hypothetical protein n=1 Tax=Bacillus sp. NPDC077411 TaxID=3363947 RepID=UPI0037C62C37